MPSDAPNQDTRLRVGSAPDSWGVWMPDDERQTPWWRFLDEVAEAGYRWIELGPYGYLPTDPQRLSDELESRGLAVSAGTCFTATHHGDAVWPETWQHVQQVAALTTAMGARNLVVIPGMWRDQDTGEHVEDRHLTDEQWKSLSTGIDRIGRALFEEYGIHLRFHPHADTHVDTQENVERFLETTDPEHVSLCLDTGHISYCGGDNLELLRKYPERTGYLHLKQVQPELVREVWRADTSFAEAVRNGVMCEPPQGEPDLNPLIDAAADVDADMFAIVEQDMFPCPPEQPLPIAQRTRQYLSRCGAGFR